MHQFLMTHTVAKGNCPTSPGQHSHRILQPPKSIVVGLFINTNYWAKRYYQPLLSNYILLQVINNSYELSQINTR